MRRFMLIAVMLVGVFGLVNTVQAQQLPGNTYIYPNGTIGYYVGLNSYRSGYYYVPPVNNGFYGPPANYNPYPNRFRQAYYGNGNQMNYPGFYYQQQNYGWNAR